MKNPIFLGVNVDHVATVRQARGGSYPDPVHAALQAELAGADGITMHLREDRRHIQDYDVERFSELKQTKLNFECAATDEMRQIALRLKPEDVCLVPEKREELTTEGGLDVVSNQNRLKELVSTLGEEGICVSMFIDPDKAQIDAVAAMGAPVIELHTGRYAESSNSAQRAAELKSLTEATEHALMLGLVVNAGHGLNRHNIRPIAAIDGINEINVGHSIIADAIFTGLADAVRDIKQQMLEARAS
ncbi:MAG: pyridoxine 5'-phosphate synthase [Gammaproteobacteria bacterium]|nr:pyridoxine 5'-phosphate synthase [Gammaproteobacteria bacterium]